MKKFLKKCSQLTPLLPALILAFLSIAGFTLSKPVLNEVVWPQKPELTEKAKKEDVKKKEEKKADKNEKAGVGNYEDGTFTGNGNGYGGTTTVQVVVSQKQITDIEVLSHNDTESYFNIAKDQVIKDIIQNQTWEVDNVTGASYSSRGMKEAVCNALTGKTSESVLPEKVEPKTSLKNSSYKKTEWMDGSYEGSASGFGGTIKVRVTIKDGKIISITVLSHSGETESYFSKAKNIIKHIISQQTPNVDTISGATYSSSGIREAVKNALKKAAGKNSKKDEKDGDDSTEKKDSNTNKTPETSLPSGKPADGSYKASASCQQGKRFNYQVEITATFKDGKLIDLKMTSTDTGKNQSYINEAWSTLKNTIMADNSGNVDAVTGATYTSNAIKTAYKEAYKKAVIAGGGKVEDSTEGSNQDTTEASTEKKTEDNTEESTEKSTEDSTEEGTEGSTEESQKESGEESTEDSKEESGEKSEEESTEDSKEEVTGPKDGSYQVTATVDADDTKKSSQKGQFYNYKISGTVKFKDGVLAGISNISLISDTVDEDEHEDDSYYTDKAAAGMVGKLKSSNSSDVDVVSGASCSSKAIIRLYEEAYAQAMGED